jgi:pyruvate dehydrogenase E1 component alpha subunit
VSEQTIPDADSELTLAGREQLLDLLRKMVTIRFFEQAAGLMYQKGMVKGGVHPYIGQEAVAVGVCACLKPTDLITSTHRGHGHHIAKGADINRLMAELLGKSSGYCAGRGGSMHVAAFDVGSLGAYPILASGVPIAVGAALSGRQLGLDYVVVSFFGEGALAQGTLHEAFNMAVIWKLPVIFVCENNQYAVSTHVSQTIAFDRILTLAEAYQIPGYDVDGQDIFAVMEAASHAVDHARHRGGPNLLHARTYRFEGHYFGEPQVYRSKEEVQEARQTIDPIKRMCAHLFEKSLLSQHELDAIDRSAQEAVEAARKFAESSPEPDPEEYARYIYAE